MARKKGKLFPGDVFSGSFSADDMVRAKKYEKGVMKPTALETVTRKGKKYSRYVHKPLRPGEFWD